MYVTFLSLCVLNIMSKQKCYTMLHDCTYDCSTPVCVWAFCNVVCVRVCVATPSHYCHFC